MVQKLINGPEISGADEVETEARMTLMEHLVELRNRIMISLAAVAIFSVIGFVLYNVITEFLTGPLTDATKNRPIEWQQSFLKARALSREQRPADLVGTALYLLSDLAGFVSGQTIVVDGGHIMY